jgi:hypothetical protein
MVACGAVAQQSAPDAVAQVLIDSVGRNRYPGPAQLDMIEEGRPTPDVTAA